jgi:hypothetical protein
LDRTRISPVKPHKAMPKPTDNTVSLKRDQIIASWREFAPDAVFANLTLAQFEVESRKPLELQERMRSLQTQLKGVKIERDVSNDAANDLFVSVTNSIRGNTDYGLNSALYRSLGYVPKAERKRPVRQSKKNPPAEAAPNAEADAA